jgi:tetratricopeptide (TPR) repeat protein
MDILTPVTSDTLFNALSDQSAQMEALSNQALGNGIDKYMKKDYKGATQEFKRALGLSPFSENAVNAAKYLVQSHLRLGETEKAIKVYKDVIKLQPERDDLQTALGNLYLAENRVGEAVQAYEAAVRIYDDANNRFSLGQGYLKAARYDDAERQFERVIKMSPRSANGYFGLGQTYSAQKKFTAAIQEFERAVQKKKDFWAAYAEMGYTYADAGRLDKAKEIRSDLEHKDHNAAATLGEYIEKRTSPKIMMAWASSTFSYLMRPKTPVSALGDYLANAGSSQSFSMVFQFNKPMARESVESPLNWTIKRSTGNGPGKDYNYGLPIANTEARISPIPTDIYWDEKRLTATVRFTITQNAAANATIDPSHIEFAFKGLDADGNRMDPKYDQFMGFAGRF